MDRWIDRSSEKGQERDRKKGDLEHLSINQCLCSAIRDSQQATTHIGPVPTFETSATALRGTTGSEMK